MKFLIVVGLLMSTNITLANEFKADCKSAAGEVQVTLDLKRNQTADTLIISSTSGTSKYERPVERRPIETYTLGDVVVDNFKVVGVSLLGGAIGATAGVGVTWYVLNAVGAEDLLLLTGGVFGYWAGNHIEKGRVAQNRACSYLTTEQELFKIGFQKAAN